MNAYAKIAVAAAAVLIVAVVGYNLLPGRSTGVGGPGPSASSTVTPASSPSTSPAATPAGSVVDIPDADTVLSPGRYRWRPFADEPTLSLVAEIPDGWRSVGSLGMTVLGGTNGPDGMGIAFQRTDALFSDACHWDPKGTRTFPQPGDVTVGPTVDDLVAALRSNTSYTSSTASPVTIDGFKGQELELQLPAQVATCDEEQGSDGHFIVFPGKDGGLYAQGSSNRWRTYILDVEGTRLIIVVLDYEGTPQAEVDAARAIVESLQITP